MAVRHEISSGNVFADLGVAEPMEALAKAELARRIASIIKHRHLTQADAGVLLSIDQPKVSKLVRGDLKDFSLVRLMTFLMMLDRDINIVVKKRPRTRGESRIAVSAA
ncbi:MAG: helix-turn-helix transcriptional regulator [Gammaproteobacteria bacterium]|nr:MAG: helix-turn-helix transcriptional regulator [Gammaproteobacteria bacterium]